MEAEAVAMAVAMAAEERVATAAAMVPVKEAVSVVRRATVMVGMMVEATWATMAVGMGVVMAVEEMEEEGLAA